MEREYLPGEVRDRIKDLMKERKVNQSELARLAGCNKSTISRFLSGQTDTIGDDAIIAIAKGFNVTADFLLGISDKPDRTTFDLAELGLTIESGKALYTSETNAIVINALLGCKSFPRWRSCSGSIWRGRRQRGMPRRISYIPIWPL